MSQISEIALKYSSLKKENHNPSRTVSKHLSEDKFVWGQAVETVEICTDSQIVENVERPQGHTEGLQSQRFQAAYVLSN